MTQPAARAGGSAGRGRLRARRGLIAVGAACLLAAAACTSQATGQKGPSGPPVQGGTATFALPVGEDFSWIFPIENQANNEPWDLNVEEAIWRPLYFAGQGNKPVINEALSIAYPPVWSNNDQTVTVRLKTGYRWSDGTPVTARDVEFFLNLERANKTQDAWYTPGSLPDDVKSVSYPGPYEFVMH